MRFKPKPLKGDTLVEVMFAVAIFGMVSIGAIGIMNHGVYTAQTALETTLARAEIDAQAEALRFIHNAYILNINSNTNIYSDLWQYITKNTRVIHAEDERNKFLSAPYGDASCSEIYATPENEDDAKAISSRSFILNTRALDKSTLTKAYADKSYTNIVKGSASLTPSPIAPRLLFADTDGANLHSTSSNATLQEAQGIWITAIADSTSDVSETPRYYDFYIRTCWDSAGGIGPTGSTTISTIVRLYNPDYSSTD